MDYWPQGAFPSPIGAWKCGPVWLDYRPGGLTHLLPTLLTPLMPVNDTVPGESMQRYRANVEHAFRVANELVSRVSDASSVGSALTLAEKLMRQGDDKARMLRVRKKRRLFVEQEKVLEVNSWGPPIPPRATTTKPGSERPKTEEELNTLLPSQNTHPVALTTAQKDLPPPTTAQAAHKYLLALHSYLKSADAKGLLPSGIPLKHVKARISSLTPDALTLELQIGSVVKAVLDATLTFHPAAEDERGELQSVELAALTIGGSHETIVSAKHPSYLRLNAVSCSTLILTCLLNGI